MDLHFILDSIEANLEQNGYVNILYSPESRKYEWQKGLENVTILLNYSMTEMRITLVDPSLI